MTSGSTQMPFLREAISTATDDGVQRLVVGVVVADRSGRILVVQRRPDDFMPNLWEIPGGGVETGETVEAAAIRELREETGITASRIAALLGSFDYLDSLGEKSRQLNLVVSKFSEAGIRLTEHQAAAWIERVDLRTLSMSTSMRGTVEAGFDFVEQRMTLDLPPGAPVQEHHFHPGS